MTLAELARRAGMWVETAQVFVQRGLLPAEGAYTEEHLAAARFVARMQAEHHLPLDTIAVVLVEECAFDLAAAEGALAALVEPDPTRAGPGPTTRATLLARTGAREATASALTGAGLLPEAGPYGGHHVWMMEATQELLGTGMSLTDVCRMASLGLRIAEAEVDAVILEVGRGATPREALDRTRERRLAVGRLVSVARHGATTSLMARLAQASDRGKQLRLESVHVPSRLFMVRHRLDAVLQQQREECEAVLDTIEQGAAVLDASALREHGRLLLGVGRFEEAARVLEQATAVVPLSTEGTTWCNLGLARAMVGRDEAALAAAERAVELGPGEPRVHVFRAAVLALLAGRAGDLLLAVARVHEALSAMAHSRELDAADAVEGLEAALTRGRICTVMPPGFGVRDQGLADLREVLARTAPDAAAPGPVHFDVVGARDLVRLNASFYLGMALFDDGESEEAAELLREVVALDPVSDYATRAYHRLQR